MGKNLNRRLRIFTQGAKAAGAVFGTAGLYPCPICTYTFDEAAARSGDLTLEHVPPESVGGKEIILTCSKCNSLGGHTVDAHAKKRAVLNRQMSSFAEGALGYGGQAHLKVGQHRVQVEISQETNLTNLRVLEKLTDPRMESAIREYFQGGRTFNAEQPLNFDLTFITKYNKRAALVSDLRTAFLACAAALGYRFALSNALTDVRKQILQPGTEIISRWHFSWPDSVARQIVLAESMGALLVKLDEVAVFLPWPPAGKAGFESLVQKAQRNESFSCDVHRIPWPQSFVAGWDLA